MTPTKKKKNFIEQWIDKKIDEITDYIGELIKASVKLIIQYFKNLKHTRKIVLAVISTICLFFYMGYKLDKIFFFIILMSAAIFYSIFFVKAFITKIKSKNINKSYKWLNELFNNQAKVVEEGKHNVTINSFIPYSDVLKKKDILENKFNKEITSINKKGNSQRTFIINFEDGRKIKFKKKYYLKDYIQQPEKTLRKYILPFLLGVDEHGNAVIGDLGKLNHLLIAGESDFGKSTFVNTFLRTLQYYNNNILYFLVDFKIVELKIYSKLNNVIFIPEEDFSKYLIKLNNELHRRKHLVADVELQNIKQYNSKYPDKQIPYLIFLIDEVADVRLEANDNKEITANEKMLTRFLNQGRAFGIHIICATQNPSGIQLSTQVKKGLTTKVSFKVIGHIGQGQVGIKHTETLDRGEFKMLDDDGKIKTLKGLYCDHIEERETFNEILAKRSEKDVVIF